MALKFLFIPVSSAKGVGEYMRSLTLAEAVLERFPASEIRFILSREAPYKENCPFPVALTPTSATNHSAEVRQILAEFSPDFAIFDAAGRADQLAYCQKQGIKTIFIGPRTKKIRRALAWRRLKNTDRIWITQPAFAIKAWSAWDNLKLRLLNKPSPLVAGPVFKEPDDALCQSLLHRLNINSRSFVLVNAGSGGHVVEGTPVLERFAQAAQKLAQDTGVNVVLVKGLNSPALSSTLDNVLIVEHLPIDEFNALLKHANVALLAGGSSLLQALSYHTPTVGIGLTPEQVQRVNQFAALCLIDKSPCEADAMVNAVQRALEHKPSSTMEIKNGLYPILDDLQSLISYDTAT